MLPERASKWRANHRSRGRADAAVFPLWLFWVAPLAGALAAGFLATWLYEDDSAR